MLRVLVPYDESTIERAALTIEHHAPNGRVLDVGGAAKPLRYATHVMDVQAYWQRRKDEGRGPKPERFTKANWLQHDVNELPWPFEDDYFDFIWCSQVVEDIRDPIAVCKEMQRLAPMGFISTVHRQFESSARPDGAVTGYGHHRWLIEVKGEELLFIFKSPYLQVHADARPPCDPAKWLLNAMWRRPFTVREVVMCEGAHLYSELRRYAEARR